ncbi:MAG: FAD-dependent thymidylate synthase [Campylobacterota bacterium]|nr:FAD-dependent thymidylate synthase [Campylobacterota bacterium]
MTIEFLEVNRPSDVAVSAARTCYFPNGIVKPEKSSEWARKDSLLSAIFKAGHHTTLQHTHVTMLIDGMSRHLIWRLLHTHPYYNSEQVSQRYAKMKIESFVKSSKADDSSWNEFYGSIFGDYEKLCTVLEDDVKKVTPKFRQKDVAKKAQEMARYILPGGMSAYLYHSANVITLLRYIAVATNLSECESEAKEFAKILSEKLLEIDESLKPLIAHAQKLNVVFDDEQFFAIKEKQHIDSSQLHVKVFDVVGDASFSENENHADILRASMMVHDSGVLGGFTTFIKHSLSSDAQNQRHRRSLAIRPMLKSYYKRDFYTPPIIANNSEALEIYSSAINRSYDFFEAQSQKIGFNEAIYALPNAHNIELIERNDFSSFHHKAQMRLCYNAQQEIYDVVYEQVKQLRTLHVKGSENFLPPCSIRAAQGIRPICPEGDHFCGIKVWKSDFKEFHRDI